MSDTTPILSEALNLDAYDMAAGSDVKCPETLTSPGARWILGVRDALTEAVDYDHADDETVAETIDRMRDRGITHEIADGAVPIYTYDRWVIFTELQAYLEDPSELGYEGTDMTELAGVCLYMIAERIVESLCRVLEETSETH